MGKVPKTQSPPAPPQKKGEYSKYEISGSSGVSGISGLTGETATSGIYGYQGSSGTGKIKYSIPTISTMEFTTKYNVDPSTIPSIKKERIFVDHNIQELT